MDSDKINQIIEKYDNNTGSLIQILLEIQKENHWLSAELLRKVSEKMNVPMSKVLHTATFYKAFNLIPEGLHEVKICDGTSCHIKGSSDTIGRIQELTGIKPGDIDAEGKFRLETVTCCGNCNSGPVMIVDGKYHECLNPVRVEEVLKDYI